MEELRYWIGTLRKVGWGCTWLLYQMTYRCGCTHRPLVRDWSWNLSVNPEPIPRFGLEECSGGWRLLLGWFELWWLKPGRWMKHKGKAS